MMDLGAHGSEYQYSYFRTSSDRSTAGTFLQSLPITDNLVHWKIDHDSHVLDCLLFNTWAVLLHAYFRNDFTCFAILPSLSDSNQHQNSLQPALVYLTHS